MTRIYSPHSVYVNGIPCHVKDVRPVHGENNTARDHVTTLDASDNEADPMVYKAVEENSSASSISSGLKQDKSSSMPEDNATEETELVPLRRSSEHEPKICTAEATSGPAPLKQSGFTLYYMWSWV